MRVAILTTEQKQSIEGKMFAQNSFFNPILDLNGNWVISEDEIKGCNSPDFFWIKTLELTTFRPNTSISLDTNNEKP